MQRNITLSGGAALLCGLWLLSGCLAHHRGALPGEPGDSSYSDMVAAIERGIIMQTNRSWSIDDYRNKFQFGCEYAQLVENGQVTKTLKNPNYRGITTPFWNKLSMVGDIDTRRIWGSPYCGKGEPNQVIRVGHAVPACLFRNLDVFGGA